MSEPTIISFYSFRGGVGRSMAMLNVGVLLARAGRRVLLVDLDLEAPGLTRLAERTDLLPEKAEARQVSGVVDLLLEFLKAPGQSVLGAEDPAVRLAADYLFRLAPPMTGNPFAENGALHLLPAGRLEGYESRLAELHIGSREFETVREPLARRFRYALSHAGSFDYVLIDARTGLSDEGYMAAKFLCRFLVVLSGLNDQNIAGTARFLRHLPEWREEKREPKAGPDKVVLVASPVCEYEDDAKSARKKAALKTLRADTGARIDFSLELPYHPRLSLFEELVAVQWPESGLGRAYRRLANMLLDLNEDNFAHWSRRATEVLRGDTEAEMAEQALLQCAAIDPERATGFVRQFSGMLGNMEGERAGKVLPLFATLSQIDPGEPMHPWQAARVARHAGRDEASRQRALKELDRAMELAQPANQVVMAAIWQERASVFEDAGDRRATLAAANEAASLYEELGPQVLAARMWLIAADAERDLGEWPAAREHVARAEAVARKSNDWALLSDALYRLAMLDRLSGDNAKARKGFEECIESMRALGDRRGIAATLASLAELDLLIGDYTKARKRFGESLEIARALGDPRVVATTLHSLAELDRLSGENARARRGYEESLEIGRALGDRRGIAVTLHSLAVIDQLSGDYAKARRACAESLKTMRALGDPREVAGTLHSLAELDRIGGDYAQARKGFEEGLAIGRALGDRRGIAVARHSLAELDRLSGDYAQARKGFEESLAISRALGDRREAAVTLASLADLDRLSGDYAKARKGFAESLVTLRALGDPHVIAVTELYLAAAEAATRPKAGMLHLRELLESVAVLAAPLVRLRGRLLLGEALAGAQQWAEALAEFRPAVAEAEKYGLLALGAQGRGGMADCLANLGHKTAAQVARKALTWFREQAPRHPAVARLESIARSRTTKRSRSA